MRICRRKHLEHGAHDRQPHEHLPCDGGKRFLPRIHCRDAAAHAVCGLRLLRHAVPAVPQKAAQRAFPLRFGKSAGGSRARAARDRTSCSVHRAAGFFFLFRPADVAHLLRFLLQPVPALGSLPAAPRARAFVAARCNSRRAVGGRPFHSFHVRGCLLLLDKYGFTASSAPSSAARTRLQAMACPPSLRQTSSTTSP